MATNRLARRPASLPMIFSSRFPEVTDLMNDAFSLLPEFTDIAQLPAPVVFPAVNLSEDSTGFTVAAELAGLADEDVKVDFTDGVLTISGEKTDERTGKKDGTKYHMWERRAGSFQRSFPFPGGIAEDKITAEFKGGVLTVRLPKAPEVQGRKHSIKINAK